MERIGILGKNTQKKKKKVFSSEGTLGDPELGRCLKGTRNSTKTSVARVSEGLGGAGLGCLRLYSSGPQLFGTRDHFHGRQFFHGRGGG